MLSIIVAFMVILSVVYNIITKCEIFEISQAVMSAGNEAVSLVITLLGVMATWGGILQIAKDSGLTDKLAKLLTPLLRKVFTGLDKDSKALKAIAMNVTANIFGLGNAATPLGIEAMKRLEEEECPGNKASRNMIMLSVFNTSSIELIPTTVIALRIAHGSASPSEIIPCVIVVSIISLLVSVASVFAFDIKKK
ncbi:MAG: spore maturation protein A [Oscillospiraceae bacterium]|nr:spore maturation protein A [Oscillospiraceae bacterium]